MANVFTSLLTLVPTLIGPTISAVEAIFGPKTGPLKLEAVINAVTPVIQTAVETGKLVELPDKSTLTSVIELVLAGMKETPVQDNCICPPPGSIITIQLPAETKEVEQ